MLLMKKVRMTREARRSAMDQALLLARDLIEPNCLILEPVVVNRFRNFPLDLDFCVGIEALIEAPDLDAKEFLLLRRESAW
jgi:hypothetical protein